jgi:hypothetical protein
MSAVLSSEMQVRPDSYYEDGSKRAIAQALEEAERMGMDDPEKIRFLIRRHYPWGTAGRKGREYKIWSRYVLAAEADLGLEPRRHKETIAREAAEQVKEIEKGGTPSRRKFELPATKEELIKQCPCPATMAEAAVFLRRHTRTMTTMFEDHDRLRTVLLQHDSLDRKVKYEITTEILIGDDEEWESAYLDAAQRCHEVWLSNELSKY